MLAHELGLGSEDDRERTESGGQLPGADPVAVSERARLRGADQFGTSGSGNHFIELQRVDRVFDAAAADAFGLAEDQLTILIHSGSRGFGHQVCSDYVRRMDGDVQARDGIVLPGRQLACAPQSSPEGRAYLAAMAAAANYAWANRHAMGHEVRQAIGRMLGPAIAGGNAAGVRRRPQRHRRPAARRPPRLRAPQGSDARVPRRVARDPALLPRRRPARVHPGLDGNGSYVLAAEPGSLERSFGTTCHGAGRRLSRTAARREASGGELRRTLTADGIIVIRCPSNSGLAEEAPFAYKDVERVAAVVERAHLARRVARLPADRRRQGLSHRRIAADPRRPW